MQTLECYEEEVGEEIVKIEGNISPTVNMLLPMIHSSLCTKLQNCEEDQISKLIM